MQSIVAIWNERDALLDPAPEIRDAASERAIRTDLLDLAIACVELRMGLAPPAEAVAARRDALRLIDEADDACGPSSQTRSSAAGWRPPRRPIVIHPTTTQTRAYGGGPLRPGTLVPACGAVSRGGC